MNLQFDWEINSQLHQSVIEKRMAHFQRMRGRVAIFIMGKRRHGIVFNIGNLA